MYFPAFGLEQAIVAAYYTAVLFDNTYFDVNTWGPSFYIQQNNTAI